MNAVSPIAATTPTISAAEQARRAQAISFGTGSTRFEGGILTAEAEAINARFISGELTEGEWIAAVLASDTVRLA